MTENDDKAALAAAQRLIRDQSLIIALNKKRIAECEEARAKLEQRAIRAENMMVVVAEKLRETLEALPT